MENDVNVIERVQTSRGELQLQRRGDHFEMISNGTFLMATYNGESERLLVSKALEAVPSPERVVIGGLGVGFSLAEALRTPSVTEVTVIEVEEKIVDWNKAYLSAFSNGAIENPRTRVIQDDLLEWLTYETGMFDAICLDIDNGPDWTVTDANNALYTKDSLMQLANFLRPQGVITFWSASVSPAFLRTLQQIFQNVTEWKIPRDKGDDDCIYMAAQPKINV